MRIIYSKLFFYLLLFLLPKLLLAQQLVFEDEQKLYDVEIIVFKHNRATKGREFLIPTPSPLRNELTLDLSNVDSLEQIALKDISFLTAEELRLNDEVNQIIRSSRYSLLLHTAWRQPGLERGKGIPLWIKGGRTYNDDFYSIDERILQAQNQSTEDNLNLPSEELPIENNLPAQTIIAPINNAQTDSLETTTTVKKYTDLYELEGTVTVTLARYLHVEVDLVFRKPEQRLIEIFLPDENPSAPGLPSGSFSTELVNTTTLHNYSLIEHRRMRSKKLHYIDHPEYGMLVLITQYEIMEEPDIPADITTTQSASATEKAKETSSSSTTTTTQ